MSVPFQMIMESEKLVAGSPKWSEPDGVDQKVKVIAALSLRGRVFRGLELIGRASLTLRNADLSFTLVYHPTDNRRDAFQLARIDWRPKVNHSNDHPKTPLALLGDVDGSHHHSFDLNWAEKKGAPLKWLPVAEPIVPDFPSVSELIDGVGKLFRIANAGTALSSPWPRDLFEKA